MKVTQPSYSLGIAKSTRPLGGAQRLTPGQALPRTVPGCWDYYQTLLFFCAFTVQAEAAGQEAIRWPLLPGLRPSPDSFGELSPGVPRVTVAYPLPSQWQPLHSISQRKDYFQALSAPPSAPPPPPSPLALQRSECCPDQDLQCRVGLSSLGSTPCSPPQAVKQNPAPRCRSRGGDQDPPAFFKCLSPATEPN